MALDVRTVLDSIIQVLKDNTSTMAGSLSAATDIKTIKAGDARMVPETVDQYPAVLIKLIREDEEFAQVGQRNNKHELEWWIVPLIYVGSNHENAEKDILTFTKNVKSVLKSNITLSSTAAWSLPSGVDYFAADLAGVYCTASIISFRTHHFST